MVFRSPRGSSVHHFAVGLEHAHLAPVLHLLEPYAVGLLCLRVVQSDVRDVYGHVLVHDAARQTLHGVGALMLLDAVDPLYDEVPRIHDPQHRPALSLVLACGDDDVVAFSDFFHSLAVSRGGSSQYFRRERNDLHEALAAKFPGHRPEDARADGLHLVGEQHRRVGIEPDAAAVGAPHPLCGAHHDGVVNLAFLDAAARGSVLDAHPDDVANVGVAAFRAAQHLDTHHSARAGVIGDIEHRLHLNHLSVSNLSGPNTLRAGSFGSRSGREKAANSTRNQNLCQALRSLPNPPTPPAPSRPAWRSATPWSWRSGGTPRSRPNHPRRTRFFRRGHGTSSSASRSFRTSDG